MCIRLYSEADYLARPAYTDPEIKRSSLAAVALRLSSMRLGRINRFPFVDPPERRQVAAGYRLLRELDAIDRNDQLTAVGRELARVPVDPRLGRILLAAAERNCLAEALVIAAALKHLSGWAEAARLDRVQATTAGDDDFLPRVVVDIAGEHLAPVTRTTKIKLAQHLSLCVKGEDEAVGSLRLVFGGEIAAVGKCNNFKFAVAIHIAENRGQVGVRLVGQFRSQVALPTDFAVCIKAVHNAAKGHADNFHMAIAIEVGDIG